MRRLELPGENRGGMSVMDAFGFVRDFNGCAFEKPTITTIAYWRANQRRVQEAGFLKLGQRLAELLAKMTTQQSDTARHR